MGTTMGWLGVAGAVGPRETFLSPGLLHTLLSFPSFHVPMPVGTQYQQSNPYSSGHRHAADDHHPLLPENHC